MQKPPGRPAARCVYTGGVPALRRSASARRGGGLPVCFHRELKHSAVCCLTPPPPPRAAWRAASPTPSLILAAFKACLFGLLVLAFFFFFFKQSLWVARALLSALHARECMAGRGRTAERPGKRPGPSSGTHAAARGAGGSGTPRSAGRPWAGVWSGEVPPPAPARSRSPQNAGSTPLV